MTEPSLSLTFDDIRDEVSELMYGGAFDSIVGGQHGDLTVHEQARVDRFVSQGLREFYNPTVTKNGVSHDWSFLSPEAELSINAPYSTGTITYTHTGGSAERVVILASGTWPSWAANARIEIDGIDYDISTREDGTNITLTEGTNPGENVAAGASYKLHQDQYNLPDDLGYIIGPLTFAQQDNAWWECIVTSEQKIRALRMRDFTSNYSTGEPHMAAIKPRTRTETDGTLQEIEFWPSIEAAATVIYRYRIRPNKLTTDAGYPYGATDHSETILQACLAVAERKLKGAPGVHTQSYQERLQASISFDKRATRPRNYGKHMDRSDGNRVLTSRHRLGINTSGVTVYKGTGSL